ncbi:MAG: DMT family transporter [Candidatus Micrarchaeota archaeon]|nr:DMT family transporter [Candidatus Micrarchaeota archaeon]
MLAWYYFALISSVLTGLATILEKRTLKVEYASAYSASFSVLIALISLLFIPFLNLHISTLNWILIYIVSLLGTITYLLTAKVFRHGSISVTSPLNATLPIMFIVIFAFLFLGESISVIQYVGIAVTLIATYLLFERTGKKDFERSKYKYLVVISAAISGVSAIMFKYLLFSTTPITYMVVSQIFMAANMAVYMSFRYGGAREILANTKVYKKELLAIVILTIGYRISYYVAVAAAPISLASPLRNTIFVVMTALSGPILFREDRLLDKLLFSALLLVGAYLIIL